jgi:hypothetical protein
VATAFKNVLHSRRDGVPRGVMERALQALEESALQNMDAFEPQQLSTTLHAMAKFRYRPFNPRFLEALEQQTFAMTGRFNAQNVANTVWAYATMGRQPGADLLMVLEGRAEAIAGMFNAQNVANTLWAYATMGREPGARMMSELEGQTEAIAGTFKAQEVANTLWAYATIRRQPGAGVMRELEGRAEAMAGTFNDQEVANTLWAYATMGRQPGARLMRELEGRGEAMAGTFKAQGVANMLWAYATMGREPGARLMRELEGRAEALAGTFNTQNVANTLWAYATMGREPGARVMRVLEGRAEAIAGTFNAQDVANTLWAYATMGREPGPRVMSELEGRVQALAGTFKAQEVANTLWAYATMGREPGARVMSELEGRAEAMAGTFNAQNVANTLWAYATMGRQPGAGLMRVLEGRTEAIAGTLTAQDVANTLWAYATMGREPGAGLMRVLEGRTEAIAGTFNAQNVANTLWAYATMGREPGARVMRVLEGQTEAMAGTFNAQEVANALWAACVFYIFRAPQEEILLVHTTVFERLVSLGKTAFNTAQLSQLHQFFVWRSLEPRLGVEVINGMQSLKETCREAFMGSRTAPSPTQQQVSETLRHMGLSVEDEVRCPKSGYSIDMYVHDSSRGGVWAVEFDGPSHYLANGAPTGATLLKRRHLQLLGHSLVIIPYWEWAPVHGKEVGERVQYLKSKLLACPAANQLREMSMRQVPQKPHGPHGPSTAPNTGQHPPSAMQQPPHQHSADFDSMARLKLHQPASVLPTTFDAHASAGACDASEGTQMPSAPSASPAVQDNVAMLKDMFPDIGHESIREILHNCNGDIQAAANTLSDRPQAKASSNWSLKSLKSFTTNNKGDSVYTRNTKHCPPPSPAARARNIVSGSATSQAESWNREQGLERRTQNSACARSEDKGVGWGSLCSAHLRGWERRAQSGDCARRGEFARSEAAEGRDRSLSPRSKEFHLYKQQQQQHMLATASNINGFGDVPGAYGNMAALHGAYGPGGAGLSAGYGGMHNSNNNVPHNFGSGNSQSGTGNDNVSLRERERERLPMRENVYGHRMGNASSSQSSSFYAQQQQQQRQHQRHSQKRSRGGW